VGTDRAGLLHWRLTDVHERPGTKFEVYQKKGRLCGRDPHLSHGRLHVGKPGVPRPGVNGERHVGFYVGATGKSWFPRSQCARAIRLWAPFLVIVPTFINWAVCRAEPPAAQAPPKSAVLKHAQGGVYYVAKDLKDRRDQLIQQMRLLKNQVDQVGISGDEALKQLAGLKRDLEVLQKVLDSKKVFVSPYKVNTQIDTTTFDLGSEKLVVITADHLKVEGWDGPGIKCVLEKTVLTVGDESAEPHLKALKVIHRLGHTPEIVGRTEAENEADEQKFQQGTIGRKLNDGQRAARRRMVREIADDYAVYREFQGKDVDIVGVEGTEFDQNRSISFGTRSAGGDGAMGSVRQRHVFLTVYLPPCKSTALRGCMVGLDVKGLKTALIVTNRDSRDRDYDGRFEIHNHIGSVRVEHVPIQRIENVQGDVTLLLTDEFANTGTSSRGNWRLMFTVAPNELECAHVLGRFTAWCGRVNLTLRHLGGGIDVRNEFGDTTLSIDHPLAPQAHRVVSEAGRIDVVLPNSVLGRFMLFAATSYGRVETNADGETLDDLMFWTRGREPSEFCNWRAFISKSAIAAWDKRFEVMHRPALVLAAENRSPGLDLISRGGTVTVNVKN
jgi:hypothetical protein